MDTLPEDVVIMILPYVGGLGFISMRQTCKRLKDIADVLEIRSRPTLWRWYVLSDFPRPCIESVAPWLYVEDKNKTYVWKMLYVRLLKISSLKRACLTFTPMQFDSKDVHLTENIKFRDGYLFICDNQGHWKLIGLDTSMKWPALVSNKKQMTDDHDVRSRDLYSQPLEEHNDSSGSLQVINKIVDNLGRSSPTELAVAGPNRSADMMMFRFSPLQQCYLCGVSSVQISTWTEYLLYYSCSNDDDDLFMRKDFAITYDCIEGDILKKLRFKTAINGFKTIVFNHKWIVAVCGSNTACVIPNIVSEEPLDVSVYDLRAEATKIKILEDLVLILYIDGILETAKIVKDEFNQMSFGNWQGLAEQTKECYLGYLNAVKDFVILGQLFAAILANGEVFLSHFDSLDHESLERNLHCPYKVAISSDTACFTRITVCVDDGLKIAILETLGVHQTSKLHVFYVDRHR